MAAELVDLLSILGPVRRFPYMGAANSRSLHFDSHVRMMQHFVRESTYVSLWRFWGMCG
jgi:hypothetical protein